MVKERFEGSAGRRLLIDALKTQKMIAGNATLAEELADLVTVMTVKTGEKIIIQGGFDNDIFFILTGSFSIIVNGRRVVAQRHINDHVGEMSAIEPSHARVATVMANEDSNSNNILVQANTILCPKKHIGTGVFDLVDVETDCLKNPRLCHVIGQAIVPPFLMHATGLEP